MCVFTTPKNWVWPGNKVTIIIRHEYTSNGSDLSCTQLACIEHLVCVRSYERNNTLSEIHCLSLGTCMNIV